MECHRHRSITASHQCVQCQKAWCPRCVTSREEFPSIKMCPECRDLARELPEERGGSFLSELAGAFRYPLVGSGAAMVIVGGIFFAILDFVSAFSIFGIIVAAIVTGYLLAYYSRVVSSSANGERELPDWPEFHNFQDDIIAPIFRAAAIILVTVVPTLYAVGTEQPELALVLGGVGLLYGPMAWMAVSLHESIWAANPLTVFTSIARVPVQYTIAAVVFVGTVLGTTFLQEALEATIIGSLASYVVGLYGMLVAMRVLGLLYFHNEERLNWFGEGDRVYA